MSKFLMDGLASFCQEGTRCTCPRDLHEAGVRARSCVQGLGGFIAGHHTVPQGASLKPLLLLLASDLPAVGPRQR